VYLCQRVAENAFHLRACLGLPQYGVGSGIGLAAGKSRFQFCYQIIADNFSTISLF